MDRELENSLVDQTRVDAQRHLALAEPEGARAEQKLRAYWLWLILVLVLGLVIIAVFVWQRRMAQALEDSRRSAELANVSKSRFLAHVSHEMQVPLHAIINSSDSVSSEMLGPLRTDAYRSYALAINQSARHLLSVINEILTFSRIESGKLTLYESQVDLEVLLADLMESMTPGAEIKDVSLSLSVAPDLPDILMDRGLVLQALENLVSNGIKFTPAGGDVHVSVGLTVDGALRIIVCDTGIGMSDEDIIGALEPFGQAQSIFTRVHGGAGLGLPLADMFIRQHQGRMLLESQKGHGTRLSVILPKERLRSHGMRIKKSPDTNPKKPS